MYLFCVSVLIVAIISINYRFFSNAINTNRPFYALFRYYNTYNNFIDFFRFHPSYYALYTVFAISFLFSKIKRIFSIKTLTYIFLIIPLLIGLIMTSSKINLISILVIGFLTFFWVSITRKLSPKLFIGFLIIFITFPIFLYNYVPNIKNRFNWVIEHEINQSDRYKSGQSRLSRLSSTISLIKQKPFIGYGTGDSNKHLVEEYEKRSLTYAAERKFNSHNQFLEYWVKIGVIPVLLLIVYLVYSLHQANKFKNFHLFVLTISISLFFMVESVLLLQKGIVFFALFFNVLHNYNKRKIVNNNSIKKLS
nr:O-antigen ligase family protein [Marivirga aurantiaca]